MLVMMMVVIIMSMISLFFFIKRIAILNSDEIQEPNVATKVIFSDSAVQTQERKASQREIRLRSLVKKSPITREIPSGGRSTRVDTVLWQTMAFIDQAIL